MRRVVGTWRRQSISIGNKPIIKENSLGINLTFYDRDGFEEKPSKPGKDNISSKDEELQLGIQASLGRETEENPYISENAEEEAYPGEFDKSYKVVWTSDEEEDEVS